MPCYPLALLSLCLTNSDLLKWISDLLLDQWFLTVFSSFQLGSITVVGKFLFVSMLFSPYGLMATIWYVPWWVVVTHCHCPLLAIFNHPICENSPRATGGYATLFTWIPEYPGYYNLLMNQPYTSLLLVKGFQPNVFYAKFSVSRYAWSSPYSPYASLI